MRTAPFTKTTRTAQKVLLIDRRENHRVGSMRHLVFKRRLPDGTPLGVLFQPHTLYRRSEIPPRAQPLVEIREVRLKILFIRLLPDLVDPGRLVRGPVKRLAQHLHIHQVYHREDPIRVLDRLLCKLLKFCGYGWRPTARYARLRLPCSGSRGLSSPPYRSALPASDLRYYAPLRLPSAPLGSLPFRWLPDTLPAPLLLRGLLSARSRRDALRLRQDVVHPVAPFPGFRSRKQTALPSSRATPLHTCPALRPRWCPTRSPLAPAGLLPSVTQKRRLSLLRGSYPARS